uniref:UBC core domain-containing protein n=1 Tax=Coccolithus braarudii TaxID=221442 RepID=A0A7S0LMY7_9EUKA|mmetsp:Transcript_4935/g.10909  ORF Transcript_4935/g.10909 Transcript_4935/m.10909 type:complete len:189 (+) Transcript_4935:88-654(+)
MNLFKPKKGRLARKKKAGDDDESKASNNKPAGWHRMQSDMASLELPENVKLDMKEDFMNFHVSITPGDGSYWKSATFRFKFSVPRDYPYTPPKITCEDKIYHPNIDLQGAVCLNILRKDWKPVLDTQAVIHGLIFLFLEPNPDDPLNNDAAAVLRKDKRQFARNVDQSLRGRMVDGEAYPRNKTYKGQ